MKYDYDIVIIWSGFAGLAFVNYLDKKYKILVIDKKNYNSNLIETTWLITQDTKNLFDRIINTNPYITNKIDSIWIFNTDYSDSFFSYTKKPWIYSTDTQKLLKATVDSQNNKAEFLRWAYVNNLEEIEWWVSIWYSYWWKNIKINSKFVVWADWCKSIVAKSLWLWQINKFLIWFEKLFHGEILEWENPESCVYHTRFWDFSLWYWGWLSPTIVDWKKAFRVWLAKLLGEENWFEKLCDFIEILKEKWIIRIDQEKEITMYSWLVPLSGVVKNYFWKNSLLIWDAAWLCWAFAADWIKWALLSWEYWAELVDEYLNGNEKALWKMLSKIETHNKLITYFKKQRFYRFCWDRMKSNRTFDSLFSLIKWEKEVFLNKFCDSKDKQKSLLSIVFNFKNIFRLIWYGLWVLYDIIFFFRKK